MSAHLYRAVLVAALGVLAGCSESGSAPTSGATALPAVLETFEVGRSVFVRSLAVEKARNSLWVGTSAGVHEIDLGTRAVKQTFTRKDGLANEYVFAIGIDADGAKWFGTNAGGVSRYRDGEWKTLFPMHGLADYWVYSFAEAADGKLWIGTWAGASLLDRTTLKFTNYVKELINEWVYGLAIDARGRVWFGTEGGVSMLDGGRWKHWTHADGLGGANTRNLPNSPNTGLGTRSRHDLSTLVEGAESYNPNYVFAIEAVPDGSVWAGTWGGGVSRFDGNAWHNFTTEDGLGGSIVYSIARESDGTLWFGTNHGVTRYDGTSWHTYGRVDGLAGDDVYAIAIAPDGDVWIGTRGGVARIGWKR